jgi:hypothetical protein
MAKLKANMAAQKERLQKPQAEKTEEEPVRQQSVQSQQRQQAMEQRKLLTQSQQVTVKVEESLVASQERSMLAELY